MEETTSLLRVCMFHFTRYQLLQINLQTFNIHIMLLSDSRNKLIHMNMSIISVCLYHAQILSKFCMNTVTKLEESAKPSEIWTVKSACKRSFEELCKARWECPPTIEQYKENE